MSRIEPSLMFVAGVPVILPAGRMKPSAWPELALAVLTEPEPAALAASIGRLESFLKVTDEDRVAVASRPDPQAIRRAHAVKVQVERRRARDLNAPLSTPDLPSDILRDLRALDRAEADAKRARAEADKARGKDGSAWRAALGRLKDAQGQTRILRIRIDAARVKQLDTRWAAERVGESEALARARGELVEIEDTEVSEWLKDPETGALVREEGLPILISQRATPKRVSTTTGLRLAYEKGDLGSGWKADELYDFGKRYRQAFEIASGLLTPEKGEGRATTRKTGPQLAITDALNDLAEWRKCLNPRQRLVLDCICGRDMTVRATADTLRAGVPSIRRSLKGGLEAIRKGN